MAQLQVVKSNVAIIGYRWTGKTTTAKALGGAMRREVVDTDKLIEDAAGKPTDRIFKDEGEIGFRFREITAVMEAAEREGVIIACGGGVVVNTINMLMLQQTSTIVLLTADIPTMVRRAEYSHKRPSLTGKSATEEIEDVMRFRGPLYKEHADFEVDTTNMSRDQVVTAIGTKIFGSAFGIPTI